MNMDKKLRSLFSYQEFENDPGLKNLLAETEERYETIGTLLSEDELALAWGGQQGGEDIIPNGTNVTYLDGTQEKTGEIISYDQLECLYVISGSDKKIPRTSIIKIN